MKYIRTKNGELYEVICDLMLPVNPPIPAYLVRGGTQILRSDVEKEAETLEELVLDRELRIIQTLRSFQIITNVEEDIVESLGDLMKFSFNRLEKNLKDKSLKSLALEVISNKNVLISRLKTCANLKEYNSMCGEDILPLTPTEYNLLKEVV